MSLTDLQVKSKIGKQAYAAVRQKILEHMEAFVENIYDLHRLTRRQHHLESICGDKEAFAAELQGLMLPTGVQEKAAIGGTPEKADEVLTPRLTHARRSPESVCITLPFHLALQSWRAALWRPPWQHSCSDRHLTNVPRVFLQAGKGEKEAEVSDERKGSNEPVLPVEEVLATALSSNSHPDSIVKPGAAGQPGVDPDDDATGAAGTLNDIGRSMRQTSVQNLDMQHQTMAAAQNQVFELPALML